MDFGDDFDSGGRRIFADLHQIGDGAAMVALIVEAARHKDRLDLLNRVLAGDEDLWLSLVPSRGDVEVLEVRIDSAAQEARQLATVFRQTLVEVQRRRGDDSGSDDDDDLAGLGS